MFFTLFGTVIFVSLSQFRNAMLSISRRFDESVTPVSDLQSINANAPIYYNPEIIKSDGAYETEEGCLSLDGLRKTKRYKKIKVRYLDRNFKIKIKTYEGFTAQIIQHETDHLSGIII